MCIRDSNACVLQVRTRLCSGTLRDDLGQRGGRERLMSDQNLLTRREFTVEWVLAVLAGATITITGCGGDDNNSNQVTNPTPQTGDKSGVISANHGLSLIHI